MNTYSKSQKNLSYLSRKYCVCVYVCVSILGAGWETLGSGSSLSVWVSAFCSWMIGVWVPCEVTEGAGCRGCRPMAFIRPMSLSSLQPERFGLEINHRSVLV